MPWLPDYKDLTPKIMRFKFLRTMAMLIGIRFQGSNPRRALRLVFVQRQAFHHGILAEFLAQFVDRVFGARRAAVDQVG